MRLRAEEKQAERIAFGTLAVLALAGCARGPDLASAKFPHYASSPPLIISEGTSLTFDVTPDGRSIVLDLLGQLWTVPVAGGAAQALTDAVADLSDDRQPAVSPDGRWIATRSDRAAGRGIWIHAYDGSARRRLAGSAMLLGDDAGLPAWLPDGTAVLYVRDGAITRLDLASGAARPLAFDSLANQSLDEPAVSPDGARLLVTGPWPAGSSRALLDGAPGAALWEIALQSGRAQRLSDIGAVRAPAYSPDGRTIAFFAVDEGRARLHVRSAVGTARVVADEPEIEPRRVRWSPDARELYYVAAGRIRRVPVAGGAPSEVPFTALLHLPPVRDSLPHLRIPGPGDRVRVRGFGGLTLTPGGARIGLLALGRLWLVEPDRAPRAVAEVPVAAIGLSWSPDGRQAAWADGVDGQQDLWVSDVATGTSRRLTHLPGVEWPIGWSPSGSWIAFTHDDRLRAVAAPGLPDTILDLGAIGFSEMAAFGNPFAWLPDGDTLLVFGMNEWPVASRACARAVLVATDGGRRQVDRFPCRPAHIAIAHDGALLAIESGLLVRHPRVAHGWGDGETLSRHAALYPSASAHGSLAYVAPDGLRLQRDSNTEVVLGWPITFTVPAVAPLLVRNTFIVQDDAAARAEARDVLVVDGRIRAIGAAGTLSLPSGTDGQVLDAGGRWLMPGLIDTHLHFIDTDTAVPARALELGITTMRDMWGLLGVGAAFRDASDAGVLSGARIVVSGPPFYPAPTGAAITSDFLWVPTDSAEVDRGLAMLGAFGAGHVKMRYVQSWFGGGLLVRRAHAFGLRTGGHCTHGLAVVRAGVAGHEHADGQCGEWEFGIRDDIVQLYHRSNIAVAPIIDLHVMNAERAPPTLSADVRARLRRRGERARDHTRRLHAGGVLIVTGSDAQGEPGGVHRELQQLVASGLTAQEALRAATSNAAAAIGLGADLGAVRLGMIADLLLLDADPRADIANTRRIWRVIKGGRVVNAPASAGN